MPRGKCLLIAAAWKLLAISKLGIRPNRPLELQDQFNSRNRLRLSKLAKNGHDPNGDKLKLQAVIIELAQRTL